MDADPDRIPKRRSTSGARRSTGTSPTAFENVGKVHDLLARQRHSCSPKDASKAASRWTHRGIPANATR
ncbi:MAG: hypothetical protein MZU97_24635 [Bacillus subtilis]|nr:hypothetical protein [Bacillus subtilis]